MATAKVHDVMTASVVAVRRHARYDEIADALSRHGVSAVPVVDPQSRVIGVVSEADLLPRIELAGGVTPPAARPGRLDTAKAAGETAAELMTQPAVTIGPDASITDAAREMDGHRVKRLPVVDADGRLLGIVSRCDLLRAHQPDQDTRPVVEALDLPPAVRRSPRRVDVDDWGW